MTETQEIQESQETQEIQETQEAQESQETLEAEEIQDTQDTQESQETQKTLGFRPRSQTVPSGSEARPGQAQPVDTNRIVRSLKHSNSLGQST